MWTTAAEDSPQYRSRSSWIRGALARAARGVKRRSVLEEIEDDAADRLKNEPAIEAYMKSEEDGDDERE